MFHLNFTVIIHLQLIWDILILSYTTLRWRLLQWQEGTK